MVDVVRNDRAAPRNFFAYKFGRYQIRDTRSPILSAFAIAGNEVRGHFAPEVLALSHIFHFRRDDPAARIVHLRDILTGLRPQGPLHDIRECRHPARTVWAELSVIFRLYFACVILLDIAARHDPLAAQARQASIDINRSLRIGVGSGCIIDAH